MKLWKQRCYEEQLRECNGLNVACFPSLRCCKPGLQGGGSLRGTIKRWRLVQGRIGKFSDDLGSCPWKGLWDLSCSLASSFEM